MHVCARQVTTSSYLQATTTQHTRYVTSTPRYVSRHVLNCPAASSVSASDWMLFQMFVLQIA